MNNSNYRTISNSYGTERFLIHHQNSSTNIPNTTSNNSINPQYLSNPENYGCKPCMAAYKQLNHNTPHQPNRNTPRQPNRNTPRQPNRNTQTFQKQRESMKPTPQPSQYQQQVSQQYPSVQNVETNIQNNQSQLQNNYDNSPMQHNFCSITNGGKRLAF